MMPAPVMALVLVMMMIREVGAHFFDLLVY
jgi:hypothetical protein